MLKEKQRDKVLHRKIKRPKDLENVDCWLDTKRLSKRKPGTEATAVGGWTALRKRQ